MKLLACHIDNFGKLCDVTLQFNDGLNVINEANAWGKSTLAAFLKAMFYGLDAKKITGAYEKERVMYRPWQGGAFGGEVDFEINGKNYRISRTFGRTEKTDEFHLYDLKTNLESTDYTDNIGAELFELDSASFRRSIYIAQNDCKSEALDAINAKLGNLVENTDDINNFENANQQLKDILNQLTPDRVTGSIKKRKNYITQLTQEIRAFEAAQTGAEGIAQKEQQVSEKIQELLIVRKNYADTIVVASEDSKRKALYAQYEAMCQDVEEKENACNAYKSIFPAGIPTEEEFQTQLQNVSKMKMAQTAAQSYELAEDELEEFSKLAEMFEIKVPTEADIDATIQMFSEIEKFKEEISRQESKLAVYNAELDQEVIEPKFKGAIAYAVFLFGGILVAAVGLGAVISWYKNLLPMINSEWLLIGAIGAGVLGALFGILGVIIGLRVSREKQTWAEMMDAEKSNIEGKANAVSDVIASLKEDIRKIHSATGNYLGGFHVYCEMSEYQSKLYALKGQAQEYLRMKEKKTLCDNEKVVYNEYKNKVMDFVKLYQFELGEDEALTLNQLQTKVTEYQIVEAAYKEICKKRTVFEQSQPKSFWAKQALCPYSLEELNSLIAECDEKIEELKTAKIQYSKQLEDLQVQLDLRDEKEEELRKLQLSQEKELHKYNLLKVTQSFLQQAKEQLTARYMKPISTGFAKYYGMLTGDESENWMIDANITLRMKEKGEFRDVHTLSAGYQDLIGICMRLALVDAMYKEEKPFLILDDPFVNLDEEKVEAGNELLKEVAEEYQVIYFTCHESRNPIMCNKNSRNI